MILLKCIDVINTFSIINTDSGIAMGYHRAVPKYELLWLTSMHILDPYIRPPSPDLAFIHKDYQCNVQLSSSPNFDCLGTS